MEKERGRSADREKELRRTGQVKQELDRVSTCGNLQKGAKW